jgi:putative FmdB family regulatory protein
MPTYSYKCNDCETKYDVFHKKIDMEIEVKCPICESEDSKKLITSANFSGFSTGNSYGLPAAPTCASGMCGLN